jgi:uncharacterized protein (TIGR02466 family)
MTKITEIFPTPIYMSEINRNLTEDEINFVSKNKLNSYFNEGNKTSTDTYILNKKDFNEIKKELDIKIKEYFERILSVPDTITPYITQSWLNYTETNQHHHLHSHPNSLVSGVFYIDCEEGDKINFLKKNYSDISMGVKEYNIFNSDSWSFFIKKGTVIMFPSSLEHMVETRKGISTRISLAFNVFIKGKIGNSNNLTELFL